MREALRGLVAAVANRQRPLQALGGLVTIASGVYWVSGPGWALIVGGVLLLADVVVDGLPPRRGAAR